MPITYGSVGDIIATVQIAAQLLKALSSSKGSAQEFQDLLIQLRTFHRCLDQLLSFWQTRKQCPELEVLSDLLLPIIRDSQGELSAFLDAIIEKYGKSLSHTERSRRSFRDIGRMIQWHVFEGDTIKRLKDKLRTSNTTITLVQMNAQSIAEETNKATVNEKLSDLIELESIIEEKLDNRFDELMSKVDEQTAILTRIYTDVGSVISAVGPVAHMSREIGELVSKLDQHLVLNSVSRNLDPIQQPVFFEDSIGRVFKIPLELINSWTALTVVLYDQFSGRQGQNLVSKGRYIVQDAATGHDLSPRLPFNASVCSGQTLQMAMLFHSPEQKESVCPRCKMAVISSSEMDIVCPNANCNMVFRCVTDITDPMEDDAKDFTTHALCQSRKEEHYETDAIYIHNNTSKKVLKWQAAEDSPEFFKRVRFITQWFDAEDSRSASCYRVGQLFIWIPSGSALTYTKLLIDTSVQSLKQKWEQELHDKFDYNAQVVVIVCFLGTTRQDSVPIFNIYSKCKRNRDQTLKYARELPWLRTGSVRIATSSAAAIRDLIIQYDVSTPDRV